MRQLIERFKKHAFGQRKYAAAIADAETTAKLYDFCERNEIDLTTKHSGEIQSPEDFDFHCTLMYSTNRFEHHLDGIHPVKMKAEAGDYDFFGEEKDVLVIHLHGESLHDMHEVYKELGLEHSYPDFRPHMTLSYAKGQKIPSEKIDFPIKFDRIVIKDIK